MIDEITVMVEERRQLKNRSNLDYKRKHHRSRRNIRGQRVVNVRKCEVLRELQRQHDEFNTHKRINEAAE